MIELPFPHPLPPFTISRYWTRQTRCGFNFAVQCTPSTLQCSGVSALLIYRNRRKRLVHPICLTRILDVIQSKFAAEGRRGRGADDSAAGGAGAIGRAGNADGLHTERDLETSCNNDGAGGTRNASSAGLSTAEDHGTDETANKRETAGCEDVMGNDKGDIDCTPIGKGKKTKRKVCHFLLLLAPVAVDTDSMRSWLINN